MLEEYRLKFALWDAILLSKEWGAVHGESVYDPGGAKVGASEDHTNHGSAVCRWTAHVGRCDEIPDTN